MTTQHLARTSKAKPLLPTAFLRMYRRITLEGLRK